MLRSIDMTYFWICTAVLSSSLLYFTIDRFYYSVQIENSLVPEKSIAAVPIILKIEYRELIYTDLYIGDKKVSAMISTDSGDSFIKGNIIDEKVVDSEQNIESDMGDGYYKDMSLSQGDTILKLNMFVLDPNTSATSFDSIVGLNFFTSDVSGHKSFVLSPIIFTDSHISSDGSAEFRYGSGFLHLDGKFDRSKCREEVFTASVNREHHSWVSSDVKIYNTKKLYFSTRRVLWSTDYAVSVLPDDLEPFHDRIFLEF
jgi:hypothetical protein